MAVQTVVGIKAHAIGGDSHAASTLAQLNSKVSDAILDDSGDSRPPTGAASGQLGGTYPSPDVRGLRETGGPTNLTMGAVSDGQTLTRSGSTIIGSAASVFGQGFEKTQTNAATTTTSATYVSALSHTTAALTGTFRVMASGIVKNTDKIGQYRLQNTTDATTIGVASDIRQKTDEVFWAALGEVTFSGAAKTFQIQFLDVVGGNTQQIRQRRIELWRVS